MITILLGGIVAAAAILFLVFNLWFIYQVFANQEQDALIGAGMIMLAIPVYYLMRRRWL